MEDLEKLDYQKYFVEEGEPGFSPERNKNIIENSIKKYEAKRLEKAKQYNEQLKERTDAAWTYVKSLHSAGTPIEKYFGKKWMAYLRGQKILETLQGEMRILRSLD